jgi:hypothetical protein
VSLNRPHSLLSFIYNTTVDPPYRLEMHMDMEVAFKRFEVLAEPVREACYGVEQAAYRLRSSSDDIFAAHAVDTQVHGEGLEQMASSTKSLFLSLAAELVESIRRSENGTVLENRISLARCLNHQAQGGVADAPWSALAVGPKGEVTARTGARLLEYVYFFMHFEEARTTMMENLLALIGSVRGLVEVEKVCQALFVFHRRLEGQKMNDMELWGAGRDLCSFLQQEYEHGGYLDCW